MVSSHALVARTVVGVRVRSLVPVHVEKPVIEVLTIIATCVKARVGSVEVPVIARKPHGMHKKPQENTIKAIDYHY